MTSVADQVRLDFIRRVLAMTDLECQAVQRLIDALVSADLAAAKTDSK